MSEQSGYEGWAILELMGHRRLIGRVSEATIAGCAMLRIDVLTKDGESTQFYSGASIYAITPTTEEMAHRAATLSTVAPITKWELPERGRTAQAQADAAMDAIEREIDEEDEHERMERESWE